MIVTRLKGGLGNQMFQYAAGYALARRHGVELKLDLSFLENRDPAANYIKREHDLVIFNLGTPAASPAELYRFHRKNPAGTYSFRERLSDWLTHRTSYFTHHPGFDPKVLDLPRESHLEGYFQDARYFAGCEDDIRRGFILSPVSLPENTRSLAEDIRSSSSVCLNVRRGDYVTNPETTQFHGVMPLEYFQRGLAQLEERGLRGKIFIFSDDLEWCRASFSHLENATLVGHEHAGPRFSTYLWLMTLCRHFLIPNSSFAWWAAWLGAHPEKTVVRPAHWFNAKEVRDVNPCPDSWIIA